MDKYDFDFAGVERFLRPFSAAALQFPEGLLEHAHTIALRIEAALPNIELCLLTDVAYGACNADSQLLTNMGLQALVHFGHSQLLKVAVPSYYVPCKRLDSAPCKTVNLLKEFCITSGYTKIAVTATAQTLEFANESRRLSSEGIEVFTARLGPLHDAEMLGCTAPRMPEVQAIFSVADGDFHVEALAVNNPKMPIYAIDPRNGSIRQASLDVLEKMESRRQVVRQFKAMLEAGDLHSVCLVLGTLGGQGSLRELERLQEMAEKSNLQVYKMAVAEVHPGALNIPECELYVELACPRLTLDWLEYFPNCLNACEFEQLIGGDVEEILVNYGGNPDGTSGCHMDLLDDKV